MRLQVVLLTVAALGTVPGQPTALPDSESDSTPEADVTLVKTPQLLYMEKLHDLLRDTNCLSEVEEDKVGGKLLATSIEATDVMGPGNTLEGLDIVSGNTYTMHFSIPRQKEDSFVQSAELWLFPRQLSQAEEEIIDVTLLITVQLEHANKPRREVLNVKWNKGTDCVPVDLTSLSRKVSNNLARNGLHNASITVSVEVISTLSQTQDSTNSPYADMCDALALKQTKTPFLVVKHCPESNMRVKRAPTTSPPPTVPTTSDGNCSTVPLVVEMTKLYGSFVLLPKYLDVRNCAGSCSLLENSEDFNNHASILERLKFLSGESVGREVSCVPVSYKPEDLLIYQDNYYAIVAFPNMIITECACR